MKNLFIILFLSLSVNLQAQYTILPKTINCDKVNLKIKDDTLYIQQGTRGSLILKNFENVVVIGKGVKIQANAGYSIWITNCKNLKLTGVSDYNLILKGGNQGIKIDNSTDIEVDHTDISETGFAGIMCKTDPTCDSLTWRTNEKLHMKNMFFHDNYIHKTGGEGMYIGYTFYSGKKLSCGIVYAHILSNVLIYNNKVDSTNADGIQVGSASGGAYIFNNIVSNTGLKPFEANQGNGIQVGDGTAGAVYNNVITNTLNSGIILLGLGDNVIHNNLIRNTDIGIFMDERNGTILETSFTITNNSIIKSRKAGITIYSGHMNNILVNNLIYETKAPITKLNTSIKFIESNNAYGYALFDLDNLNIQGYHKTE